MLLVGVLVVGSWWCCAPPSAASCADRARRGPSGRCTAGDRVSTALMSGRGSVGGGKGAASASRRRGASGRWMAVSERRRVIRLGDRTSSRREMKGGVSSGNWLINDRERCRRPAGEGTFIGGDDANSGTGRLGPGDDDDGGGCAFAFVIGLFRTNPDDIIVELALSNVSDDDNGRGLLGGLCASRSDLETAGPPPPYLWLP